MACRGRRAWTHDLTLGVITRVCVDAPVQRVRAGGTAKARLAVGMRCDREARPRACAAQACRSTVALVVVVLLSVQLVDVLKGQLATAMPLLPFDHVPLPVPSAGQLGGIHAACGYMCRNTLQATSRDIRLLQPVRSLGRLHCNTTPTGLLEARGGHTWHRSHTRAIGRLRCRHVGFHFQAAEEVDLQFVTWFVTQL